MPISTLGASARWWYFEGAVWRELEERAGNRLHEPWPQVRARIDAARAELLASNGARAEDEPSRVQLELFCTALAAYRVLGEALGSKELALEVLGESMRAPMRRIVRLWLYFRMGINPLWPEDAFDRIRKNFRRRGEEAFGKGFTYATQVEDHQRTYVNVTRCLFAEVARANGALELLKVLCPLDDPWGEELNAHPARYRVHFERPTTIGEGADACRFQFTRLPKEGVA